MMATQITIERDDLHAVIALTALVIALPLLRELGSIAGLAQCRELATAYATAVDRPAVAAAGRAVLGALGD